MSRITRWLSLGSLAIIAASLNLFAAEAPAVNLFGLPSVKVEDSSLGPSEAADLTRLTDGNRSTMTTLTASEAAPFSVIYGFGGATVSPDQLSVFLPSGGKSASATKVDLLVSTLSAHAGFQSVRSDLLKPSDAEHTFAFQPVAARWIMLRLTPSKEQKQIVVAEIALRGHEGPPVSHYHFKESPAKAFDVLRRLQKLTALNVSIGEDEASLFSDAREGKLHKWTFGEAALLASGVTRADERRRYLDQLAEIEKEARAKIEAAKSPFEKGEALLRYLHAGPMKKGYVSRQTDVAAILDTGTYNCVSSATLYNVVARQLGLEARGVEVPNHAFSIVYDGTDHADVETTTAGGFNPARDQAAQEQFTKLTGFAYIPDSSRDQRREVNEVGLIAITYYNHGVELTEKKRYHEALLAYFCSMSLDSEFDSAVKNALSVLANWSVELSRQKKFDEAIQVLSTGLDLAPHDATLVNNHQAVWSEWADSLIRAHQTTEALSVLDRATKVLPNGPFQRMRAWVFIQPGEEFAKAERWEAALAVVEPGLKQLDGEPRKELDEWGQGLYHRWANAAIAKKDFDKAVGVLEKGLAARPADPKLTQNLAYSIQEWAADVYKKEGIAKSELVVASMVKRYPNSEEIGSVAKSHLQRSLRDLADQGRYEEALAAANRAREWLRDSQVSGELVHVIYDEWASARQKHQDWKGAADVYAQALARFPNDAHLKNNQAATWDSWADSQRRSNDWDGTLDIYEKAWKVLGDKQRIEQNIAYCVQEGAQAASRKGPAESKAFLKKQLARFKNIESLHAVVENHVRRLVDDLVSHEKYDEALSTIDGAGDLLGDPRRTTDLADLLYDRWAQRLSAKKDWQGAVDVYDKGLKRFPGAAHLEQNAVATWYQWANGLSEAKDWRAAIGVYERGLKRFPTNSVLKNNLEYCRQQAQSK
jgi:tetratricopeptide (TPR) repeat protein